MAQAPAEDHFFNTALYVGDLDSNVTEDQLYDHFNVVAQVVSIRICRDSLTQKSLGYGYVNFSNVQDGLIFAFFVALLAAKALNELNFSVLEGKPIRVMYSNRDPTLRRTGAANLFIKVPFADSSPLMSIIESFSACSLNLNLDKSIDHKDLFDVFATFGNILSCKVARDASGVSKGHAFVQFDNEASAKEATDRLNGMLLNDKKVYVGPFMRKKDREAVPSGDANFSNVYVKNLSHKITDAELGTIFGEYGPITSAAVMKDAEGRSKGFGFVNFTNAADAARARDALDGKTFDGRQWYVGKAQRKTERELELKERHEQNWKPQPYKQGTNLYIKNLDSSIGDEELKEIFSGFGTITSSKIMRDPNGVNKGYGFVAYTNPEDANRALASMNGQMIAGKPLYVSLAEKKEDRRARLEVQFSQMRIAEMRPQFSLGAPPRILTYPMRPPEMTPQLLYGQPHRAIITQTAFGFQQQFFGGGTGPAPVFYPVLLPPPRGPQEAGPMRLPILPQQVLFCIPLVIPLYFPFSIADVDTCCCGFQMGPRGPIYHNPPPAPNAQNIPPEPKGTAEEMPPFIGTGQPMPIQALAAAVANATTPDQKRILLGETLFPLVEKLVRDAAPKVTGMLLEMDHAEVLHLIESPDALDTKVTDAMYLLRKFEEIKQSIDQLTVSE
ncbi:unnamed protein product [Sphenostylis stenocarpa]|uniref:PABP n=1 Tax=Sphenostylis stenocarpa TaxID=92480 RepID=A0AA86T3M8_9FABA|nr:unnamed protein product [Sphenostylis stenocarpa]